MVSIRERPKRQKILEMAIAISMLLHLLFGALIAYRYPQFAKVIERTLKPPKDDHRMAALSTTITIEKKTVPRAEPPARPQPQTKPQPRVAVVPKPAVPKPIEKPLPVPVAKPTELAKIVPHAKEQAPRVVVPKVVAQIRAPHANPSQEMSQQQLTDMEHQFAQTIADARAANDPTHVAQQGPPQTMKHARIDIEGINELLRHGEGILTPREAFRANVDGDSNGTCYYVDYQINFSNGTFDSGPVYWPICYQHRSDPFVNQWRGFPLPGPQPGWQPTPAEWAVISAHPLLRLYFPGRFPASDNN